MFYRINLNFVNSSNMYEKKKTRKKTKEKRLQPRFTTTNSNSDGSSVVVVEKRYAHKKQMCFTLKSSRCKVVLSGKDWRCKESERRAKPKQSKIIKEPKGKEMKRERESGSLYWCFIRKTKNSYIVCHELFLQSRTQKSFLLKLTRSSANAYTRQILCRTQLHLYT